LQNKLWFNEECSELVENKADEIAVVAGSLPNNWN
jgi:hypothetical protein